MGRRRKPLGVAVRQQEQQHRRGELRQPLLRDRKIDALSKEIGIAKAKGQDAAPILAKVGALKATAGLPPADPAREPRRPRGKKSLSFAV